jgi:hypothetical protein
MGVKPISPFRKKDTLLPCENFFIRFKRIKNVAQYLYYIVYQTKQKTHEKLKSDHGNIEGIRY